MPENKNKAALEKKVCELKEQMAVINSETAEFDYGGGACSHFTNGACLINAAEEEHKNQQKDRPVIKFINEGPLKLFVENYLVVSKDKENKSIIKCKRTDWADFTKYPIQALEYSKNPDQKFYGLFSKLFKTSQEATVLKGTYHTIIIEMLEKIFCDPDKIKKRGKKKRKK